MEFFHIVVLALVQGITEFLPVSSSAHLILLPAFIDWQDQGLAFDISVHVGTLLAVVIYFRRELIAMLGSWWRSAMGGPCDAECRLLWQVLLASIPIALIGLLLSDQVETWLRSTHVIAVTTVVFGLLLWWADRQVRQGRDEHSMQIGAAMLIGLSQALALVPGVSRSGITMTVGLMVGLDRTAAARFSFLLSIPAILMAGSYKTYQLVGQTLPVDWTSLAWGALLSFVSAMLCIHWFLALLERLGFLPFVIYRLLLGIALWIWFT